MIFNPENDKDLVTTDTNNIYFLNTTTNKYDKTIANINRLYRKIVFSDDGTKMFNVYAGGIEVFDYPALNLIKSVHYENGEILNILDAKYDDNHLTILAKDRICWYADDADAVTTSTIPGLSDKLKAIELSPKGDYALLYTRYVSKGSKDTFLVMNVYSKEIKYKFIHHTWAAPFEIHFFGLHKRLTYSYDNGNSPLFTTF